MTASGWGNLTVETRRGNECDDSPTLLDLNDMVPSQPR